MAVFEIALRPQPQLITARFPSGASYILRLIYLFTPNDCWELDISDALNNPLVCGIPLVTGADLLAQYAYLGFGCKMYCATDGDRAAVPRFFNLGVGAHLYLSTPPD